MEKTCEKCDYGKPYLGSEWPNAIIECDKNKFHYSEPAATKHDRSENGEYPCKEFTPKKPKEERTCKECEFYELYDGPEHPDATWRCKKEKVIEGSYCDGYYNVKPSRCKYFTPKSKPAEKEVERGCKTCRLSCTNEGGCPEPETILCTPENNYAAWQPIEKPKKSRSMYRPEYRRTVAEIEAMQMAANPPIMLGPGELNWMKETPKPPKQKEKTMKITKLICWPIRRYVATCVVIVTAKICIWLNPLVFFVGKMIFRDPELYWDSGNWEQIVVVWACTIAAVAGVIIALYLYNQFCKKLCKMIGNE